MDQNSSILEQYQSGEIHTRLNMYLDYRDLRDIFMEIELKDHHNRRKEKARQMKKIQFNWFTILSMFFGGGSLLYFLLFLIFGTGVSIDLDMGGVNAMLTDAFLCFLFFGQHSIMVRQKFKTRVLRGVPDHMIPGLFSIVSGITLMAVVFFWQKTTDPFFKLPSWGLFVMASFFILSLSGMVWGVKSLPFFDPFGIRTKKGCKEHKISLKPKGPYQYIRHPLYFFCLILIWSSTVFTIDRLMFNLLWTVWMVIGSRLEEKELEDFFGQDYVVYQQQVPMLLPFQRTGKRK